MIIRNNLHGIWIVGLLLLLTSCSEDIPAYKVWHTITLDFNGPDASENDRLNPFLDFRLDVTFTNGDTEYIVPGYYAADGNAAETSADRGNVWRVKFTPDISGKWKYKADFKRGDNVAVMDVPFGKDVALENREGSFKVLESDFQEDDPNSKGRLSRGNHDHYQQFLGSGTYYIKGGADSPENFLGYVDFDSTYNYESSDFLHHYEPHANDWQEGDTAWQGKKGKNIIGALNYLASKGMNAIYFLTMNIQGDGKDVWPYVNHEDLYRFDCSKLDQWDIVFNHAQKKGILLQFVLQETENELLLDEGNTGIQRKLYLRELIARFGHHNAVVWNIGEENGPADFSPQGQTTRQTKTMLEYIARIDPYNHLRVIHTHSTARYKDSILLDLLGFEYLDGLSLQVDDVTRIGEEIAKWKRLSREAGHPWIIYMDEIGPYWQGALPDAYDIDHDTIRKNALWGSLMNNAGGAEWYFGYKYPHADLNCEDWRSREKLWDQTRYALEFFQKYLPFHEMNPDPKRVIEGQAFCLAKQKEVYAFYIPDGEEIKAELSSLSGKQLEGLWYDPKTGKETIFVPKSLNEDYHYTLTPPELGKDWVVVLKVKE